MIWAWMAGIAGVLIAVLALACWRFRVEPVWCSADFELPGAVADEGVL